MTKKSLLTFALALLSLTGIQAADRVYQVTSPSGEIRLEVSVGEEIAWSVSREATTVLTPSPLSMTLTDGTNAHRAARDYKREETVLPADGIVQLHMAPGGGWVAIIR